MKLGAEDKKKRMIAGVVGFLALLAIYALYQELFADSSPSAPVQTVGVPSPAPQGVTVPARSGDAGARRPVVLTAATLDPTLHVEAMRVTESLVYSGNGRNIFSAMSAPTPIVVPKPIQPARPLPPPVPVAVLPTGPPPPPPIDLKFFGTSENPPGSGKRQVFFRRGEDVFMASAGEVVMRRYRVVAINANSVQVEDMPNNNVQTLPLLAN